MDDQQHALSALLLLREHSTRSSTRDPDTSRSRDDRGRQPASRARRAALPTRTPSTGFVAIGVRLALVGVSAVVSGPLLDLVDVTGPSARIAAGIALLVVCAKDVFAPPPTAEPALAGWRAGLVPLAFPVVFSPGPRARSRSPAPRNEESQPPCWPRSSRSLPSPLGLVYAPHVATSSGRGDRRWRSAVGLAALVVLDGVYAI